MTLKQLREAAKEWQSRLGLSDWKITVIRGDETNMAGDDYAGHAYWKPEYQEATIIIARGEGLDVLIHELIHVRLEAHRECPRKYDALYERGINALTDAFIALKRGISA